MVHEDYKEMSAAQALGALEAADIRDLEAHFQGCAECRSQLDEWEETAARLVFTTTPIEPSPQLRGRILEAIRVDATNRGPQTGSLPAAAAPGPTGEDEVGQQPPRSNVLPLNRQRTWSSTQTWSAIAAGLVLVGLIASLFVFWKQNREARQELARLSGQVRDAQKQLLEQRMAIDIVAAPGTRMTKLAGTKVMPGAHAMFAYDRNGSAILMAKGLTPAPAGKAYQLWFIAGGRWLPGKVLLTDSSGAGTLKDQIPAEARKAAVFAVTLEPEEGVKSPTGEIYLISPS